MSAPQLLVGASAPPTPPYDCGPVSRGWLFPIVGLLVVVGVAAAALLWYTAGHPTAGSPGPWTYPWPIFPFVFPFVFPFLFFVVLWVGFFRWGAGWGRRGPWVRPPTALDLLEARYARGELTRDQFREMRAELTGPLR